MIDCVKRKVGRYLLNRKTKARNTIIKSEYVSKDLVIGKWCLVGEGAIIESDVKIGDYSYLNTNKYWSTIETKVSIGSFCSIAPNVHIGAGNHNYLFVSTHPFLFNDYYRDISDNCILKEKGLMDANVETIIGNDVWIGFGVIIKRGIHIGNGAVIAAGSVVVSDVPAFSIVGGNPAKVIKYRTNEENIKKYECNNEIMWWNWKTEDLCNNIDEMYDFEDYNAIIDQM